MRVPSILAAILTLAVGSCSGGNVPSSDGEMTAHTPAPAASPPSSHGVETPAPLSFHSQELYGWVSVAFHEGGALTFTSRSAVGTMSGEMRGTWRAVENGIYCMRVPRVRIFTNWRCFKGAGGGEPQWVIVPEERG